MKLGKVSESVLKRSILKSLDVNNTSDVRMPGVGRDSGMLEVPEGMMLVATTDPITTAHHNLPALAVHNVINDLVVTGAVPKAVLVTILLSPDKRESYIKKTMGEIHAICKKYGVEVIGGHTETTDALNRPIISMTGLGFLDKKYYAERDDEKEDTGIKPKKEGVRAGQDIVMTKGIGIEGTAIMAYDRERELMERFAPGFIRQCQQFIEDISVFEEAGIAREMCTLMHDVSDGGLFGSLWEIAEEAGLGLEVDMKKILIRQETIEVCETFDVNPYTLISGGTLLAVTPDGKGLAEKLNSRGIPAAVIGRMTQGNDRVLLREEERRYLEPPKADNNIYWEVDAHCSFR